MARAADEVIGSVSFVDQEIEATYTVEIVNGAVILVRHDTLSGTPTRDEPTEIVTFWRDDADTPAQIGTLLVEAAKRFGGVS